VASEWTPPNSENATTIDPFTRNCWIARPSTGYALPSRSWWSVPGRATQGVRYRSGGLRVDGSRHGWYSSRGTLERITRMLERHRPGAGVAPGHEDHPSRLPELLQRAGRGDSAAYERLYDLVAPRLFGLILRIVGDRAMAEDVLQETMLRVWCRASSYDSTLADPMVWLLLIARGKSVDALRRRESASAVALRLSIPAHTVEQVDTSEDAGLHEAATLALASLPAEQRDVLVLAFQGGLTGPEIARCRELPLGTVKTRIRSGLLRLRETFARPSGVSA